MNYQQGSKCTVRIAAETITPAAGTDKDPFNLTAEKKMIEDLRAIQPNLDFTWFDHFQREVLVPEEVVLSNDGVTSKVPFKNQRLHGLDLSEGAFMLKSYFMPAIRSAITGIETTQIMFESIRKLNLKNANIISALNTLEDWMVPTNGRFMEYWDGVSYDAIDADKARIKVYTGICMKTLEQVRDVWTLGGRLQGEDIEKGFDLVARLWRRLMDEEPSTCEMKYWMQWVWELRTDVPIPVPKLYFSVAAAEDHYVSDAVVEILDYLGWDEHVQTHRALMDEAW
jgi:fumigaclavine A dimethylallyltransferase